MDRSPSSAKYARNGGNPYTFLRNGTEGSGHAFHEGGETHECGASMAHSEHAPNCFLREKFMTSL